MLTLHIIPEIYMSGAFTGVVIHVDEVTVTAVADATGGYCITTLHDYVPDGLTLMPAGPTGDTGSQIANADGYIYVVNGSDINLITESTLAWLGNYLTAPGVGVNLATGLDGVVYWCYQRSTDFHHIISKSDHFSITDPWIDLDTLFSISSCTALSSVGADGNLYGWMALSSGGGPHVLKVTPAGVASLTAESTDGVHYVSVTARSDGTIGVVLSDAPAASPNFGVNSVVRVWTGTAFTDFAIQSYPVDEGIFSAQAGIYVDATDAFIIPMYGSGAPSSVSESWFLRFDGTTSLRIAGTWQDGPTPPTLTSTNIADGPVATALASYVFNGCGLSLDRTTLYFVDDGDQASHVFNNLLRKLAPCPAAHLAGLRWGIHMGAT